VSMKELPMRLAMRAEGGKWNAYVAKPGTMEDSIWIGSIAMRFVVNNEKRKNAFLMIMTEAVGEVIEEVLGKKPKWNEPVEAPEHERSRE
jgi:hypothetical protein